MKGVSTQGFVEPRLGQLERLLDARQLGLEGLEHAAEAVQVERLLEVRLLLLVALLDGLAVGKAAGGEAAGGKAAGGAGASRQVGDGLCRAENSWHGGGQLLARRLARQWVGWWAGWWARGGGQGGGRGGGGQGGGRGGGGQGRALSSSLYRSASRASAPLEPPESRLGNCFSRAFLPFRAAAFPSTLGGMRCVSTHCVRISSRRLSIGPSFSRLAFFSRPSSQVTACSSTVAPSASTVFPRFVRLQRFLRSRRLVSSSGTDTPAFSISLAISASNALPEDPRFRKCS